MFPRVFSHHHSPLKPKAATKPTKSLIHYPRNGLLCLPKRRDFWYSVLVHENGEWYMYTTSTMPGFGAWETTVQKPILDPFFFCNLAPCVLCCKLLGKAHLQALCVPSIFCPFCLSFGDLSWTPRSLDTLLLDFGSCGKHRRCSSSAYLRFILLWMEKTTLEMIRWYSKLGQFSKVVAAAR